MGRELNRRTFLKRTVAASTGSTLALSLEEKILLAQTQKNKETPKKRLQKEDILSLLSGKIGNVNISRLILGGNLIGGAAHSRDLIYVSDLIRNYFTDEKIMETWQIAEECGVNTMSAWSSKQMLRVFNRYRKERGGKIQWLGHTSFNKDAIKTCIDNGAVGIYVCGDPTDRCIKSGRLDLLADAISLIKENGLFAGIACHAIRVLKAVEAAGIEVDFYMKTLHHGNYWSVAPKNKREFEVRVWYHKRDTKDEETGNYHDNIWGIGLHKSDSRCKSRDTWQGTNWLGEALTKVRDRIIQESQNV